MLKVLGITGGIGSGKSTVCRLFYCLGIPFYDADHRGKILMKESKQLKEQIIEKFGEESYSGSGLLNTKHLASVVFSNKQKLEALNAIVHPAVGEDFIQWKKTKSNQKQYPFLIKESAIVLESNTINLVDALLNVTADEQIRINRVLTRDPYRTEKEIKEIIGKQMSDHDKNLQADFSIDNGEKKMLIPQVLRIYKKILATC